MLGDDRDQAAIKKFLFYVIGSIRMMMVFRFNKMSKQILSPLNDYVNFTWISTPLGNSNLDSASTVF